MDYNKHRHTKIIFTIGPATESEEMLEKLILSKVDICRLNMAHGTHEWARNTIRRVRKMCEKVKRYIAIMMDVKGPEIRTGIVDEVMHLKKGDLFDLYTDKACPDSQKKPHKGVDINYKGFIDDVHVGDLVVLDSGLLHFKVLEKRDRCVRCEVLIGGPLKSKRHINLPGVYVSLPALTEKDKGDINIGIEEEIEFFALSFVRKAKDVHELRNYLRERNSKARIISKIEDQTGIKNLDSIIEATDALMVARGDLGIECPYEQLPIIQLEAVKGCIRHNRPVIVATHMLESMITAPIPTRAEVTDVTNAVMEQVDCIMLSGETTVGQYPLKCIEVMKKISYQVETHAPLSHNSDIDLKLPKNKMLKSAVVLAQELENTAIMVFTRSGSSAQIISTLRPSKCPVYVFTDNFFIAKQMRILWGIEPLYMQFFKERNRTIDEAIDILKARDSLQKDDYLIVLTNVQVNGKSVDTIQLRKIS